MKKLFLSSLIVLACNSIFAQQVPLYSQYTMNHYLINPAIAGSKEYYLARLTYRNQWTGFSGAPSTAVASGHGMLPNKQMGVGAILYNDVAGIFGRTGFQGTYAHHLEINSDMKVSLGLSLGLMQYRLDKDAVKIHDEGDQVIAQSANTLVFPDADAGAYLYAKDFYVGLSSLQMIQSKIKLSDVDVTTKGKIFRHFYLIGGYKYQFNDDIAFEPSICAKYVAKAPLQLDVNMKSNYQNVWWLGLTYRTNREIVIQTEMRIMEYWIVGYSYDIYTSSKASFNNGSYGIMVGYNFGKDNSKQRKFR